MRRRRHLFRRLWLPSAVALAAVWIDLSRFHQALVADALIPILSSLYAWEPFFWEQSRIGTLVPLVAAPISSPWNNLLFQTWISVVTGLAVLVLLVRYLYDRQGWRQIALANVAVFVLVAPQSTRYVLLSTQVTYGAALSLGLAALLVLRSKEGLRKRSLAVALLFSIVAHWLNGATALLLLPLAITHSVLDSERFKFRRPDPRGVAGTLILALGFAAGQVLAWASPYPLWHLQVLGPRQWPEAWARIAASTWNEVEGPWLVVFLASGAVGFAVVSRGSRYRSLSLALPLCFAAMIYWLLLGASEWVKLNNYHPRYAMPAVLCLHTAAVITALMPLTRRSSVRSSQYERVAVSVFLAAAIVWSYGPPSPARARQAVDQRLGGLDEDVVAGGVTHVLGSYGTVWTTVYHSNLLRYEGHRPGVIWGIAHRAGPTARYWREVPFEQWRVGVKSDDPSWQEIARLYRLPELTLAERVGDLLILTPIRSRGSATPQD